MNGHLLLVLALGIASFGLADGIFLVTTGVTVGAGALAAGAAAVGALALGAVALGAKRGRRRGRREAACLPFSNPELYFSIAANADLLDCGRRFVCELEAAAEENLAEEEVLIRNTFARESIDTNGTASSLYVKAGILGASRGLAACAEAFSTCPFDRKTIYLAFQEARTTQ